MAQFGKPNGPILDARPHLFRVDNNDRLVERSARIYECYRQQPVRTQCKVCDTVLTGPALLEKFGVPYYSCGCCGHLNGGFQDTEAFNRLLFTDAGGIGAADYSDDDRAAYGQRVLDIYRPKGKFLFDALAKAGKDPQSLSYCELGAGAGHFVYALRELGAQHVRGWEVSSSHVAFGNSMLGGEHLAIHQLEEVSSLAQQVEADVACMIFMLEHVDKPRALMEALGRNPRIRHLLVAVPMVSPSMFTEAVFPTVFERHLSAHTHLFTEQSLAWLADHAGFNPIDEWWFGADAMDLFRSVAVRMRQEGHSEATVDGWITMMGPLIDDLQLAIDRHRLSSEVHLVLQKKN